MLSDVEIDILPRELLTQIIEYISDWNPSPFDVVQEMDSGELVAVYSATGGDYGSFSCEYFPLEAIKKLIRDCEQLFEEFYIEVINNQTGTSVKTRISEQVPESLDVAIRMMTDSATAFMLASLDLGFRKR